MLRSLTLIPGDVFGTLGLPDNALVVSKSHIINLLSCPRHSMLHLLFPIVQITKSSKLPSPSKAYPVKQQIPKNIWPSLDFKQQPLSQISSVAAGTTFYRFSHKRLKEFPSYYRQRDADAVLILKTLLSVPSLSAMAAEASSDLPRLPDLLRRSHQATTRCVLLLRPARRPQTRESGNQNGHL